MWYISEWTTLKQIPFFKHHIYNITNLHCTECPESQSRQEPAVQTYSSESSDTAGGRRMCDVFGW